MKFLLLLSLCLFLSVGDCADRSKVRPANTNLLSFINRWPTDTPINVYFVRDMFSAGERQALQLAMEAWTKRMRVRGSGISFVFAGETGGMIDCERCLTIARQGISTSGQPQRVTLNILRQDETGRLLSAWIAVERVAANSAALRSQLLLALERGLAADNSRTSKRER